MASAKAEAADTAAEKSDLSTAIAKDGEVLRIPVEDIEMGDRLRPVDHDWATRLGELMRVDGQRDPIWVCRLPGRSGFTLVAGAHRYTAHCLFPELGPVRALLVDSDKLSRREGEVIENLHRKGLDPIDRATFMAELVTVKKLRMGVDPSRDGRTASVAARWQQQVKEEAEDTTAKIALAYGWTAEVAEEVGISPRSVEYDLMLIRRLSPAVIDILRQHKHHILSNASQLRALAKSEPAEQLKAAEKLCGVNRDAAEQDRPLPKTLAEAMALVQAKNGVIQPVRTPEQKRFRTVIDLVTRMSPQERRALLQSPMFHDLLPPEAGRLLISMRRDGVDRVEEKPQQPAVAIRQSVKPDYIACLECGERHAKLRGHLTSAHQITKADYLAKWKLPADYPLVAPNFAQAQFERARALGLKGPKGGAA